eukprot:3373607-Pyramimonas_sp.AAC.1
MIKKRSQAETGLLTQADTPAIVDGSNPTEWPVNSGLQLQRRASWYRSLNQSARGKERRIAEEFAPSERAYATRCHLPIWRVYSEQNASQHFELCRSTTLGAR